MPEPDASSLSEAATHLVTALEILVSVQEHAVRGVWYGEMAEMRDYLQVALGFLLGLPAIHTTDLWPKLEHLVSRMDALCRRTDG